MRLFGSRRRGGTPMTCRELVEVVTAYVEGTLDERDRRRFDEHIRLCDGCTHYVDQFRTTIRLTGNLNHTELPIEARDRLLEAFRDWKRSAGPEG